MPRRRLQGGLLHGDGKLKPFESAGKLLLGEAPIDGQWVERNGRQTWEPGTLLRLIVEYDNVLVQLQVDPRGGWDADQLARIAASLGAGA